MLARLVVSSVAIVTSVVIAPSTHRCSLTSELLGGQHPRRFTRSLQERGASLLQQEQWSPEQISGRLRLEGIAMVGKTTIYNWLHADKRSGGDLYSYCRHGLKYRRKRLSAPCNSKKRGRYKSILDRPEIIDERGRMRRWRWT